MISVCLILCIIVDMKNDQVMSLLHQLRGEINRVLSKRIEGIYLYGSQARGDARPDSDIDVLVVIQGDFRYFDMVEQTGEIVARLSLQFDTVISLAFTSAAQFQSQKTPFLLNVRREGIRL